MGKELPTQRKRRRTSSPFAVCIAQSLDEELKGSRRAIKTIMKWTGASERTVKGWLAGSNGPSGEHMISLIRCSNRVFKCVMDLTGRKEVIASKELVSLQKRLRDTIVSIDAVVALELLG